MELQTMKRVKLTFGLDFGILVISGGQVVEMKDNSVAPSGVAAFIGAVESVVLRRAEFKIDVAG